MRYAVYLPLILSLVLAPPLVTASVRRLPDHLHPRTAVRTIRAAMLGTAAASTLSLGLLIVGGVAHLVTGPTFTERGHADPGGLLTGVLAGLLLVVALGRLGWMCLRLARRRRVLHRWLRRRDDEVLSVVDDEAVYAWAAPGSGRRRGSIVLSSGLLGALDDVEARAVVAHEQEHLDGRHHRSLMLAAVAVAVNPALGPLRRDLGYALERCADEAAARRLDDREVVARAIGRAALAARTGPTSPRTMERSLGADAALMLGATGGPVPRRVAALLTGTGTRAGCWSEGLRHPVAVARSGRPLVVLTACVVLAVAGLALVGAVHAAFDLADIVTTGTRT